MDSVRISMKEYKPLSFQERINDLENKRFQLLEKRSLLVDKKKELELELSECTSLVRTTYLVGPEYNEICKKQFGLKREKAEIEKKLSDIKKESDKINNEIDNTKMHLKKEPSDTATVALGKLRDTYMSFASDTTRVSSMRAMASKFVEEIQSVIKELKP